MLWMENNKTSAVAQLCVTANIRGGARNDDDVNVDGERGCNEAEINRTAKRFLPRLRNENNDHV